MYDVIPDTIDGLRVPAKLVARARVEQNPDHTLRVVETPSHERPNIQTYTALICDGGAHHYFHFMEAMIWLWTLQHEFLGGTPPSRIVFTNAWDNPAQNHVQREVLAALYPGVPIDDPGAAWPASIDNVLIFDRSWAGTKLNKILEPALSIARPHVRRMSHRVRGLFSAFEGPSRSARILIVKRPPPRCFTDAAEQVLCDCLATYGSVSIVDFAALPWEQQVRVVAAHDVLAGVHGNGLTNALWMRPGSLVLEFFSDGARHYDYQFFAELNDLQYFGFSGIDRIFPAFSRTGEPYGHGDANNVRVSRIPTGEIDRIMSRMR